MVVRRPAGVPDRSDHVPSLDALSQRGDEGGVVIVDRVYEQPLELAVVADGDGVRPLLRRTGEHYHAVANGVDRRPVGVVELDALMLLKVAAHGRAVAVRLVDEGLIGGENRALEPGVPQRIQIRVRTLLVRNADEAEPLVEATRRDPRLAPDRLPAWPERQERRGGRHRVAQVERVAVLLVHTLSRGGVDSSRRDQLERLDRRHVHATALHNRRHRASWAPSLVEPGNLPCLPLSALRRGLVSATVTSTRLALP